MIVRLATPVLSLIFKGTQYILQSRPFRTFNTNAYCLLAPATKWTEDIPTSEIALISSKFAPTEEDDMDEHMPTLSSHSLRAIAAVQTGYDC